jgi:drug/metabolite transporter (DMT)-like permease
MVEQLQMSGRAWGELLLLAIVWGASFLAFAIALEELPVYTVVGHRIVWGALLLLVISRIVGIALPRGWKIWGACVVMGLFNNVIPFSLIAWGQTTIESGLAAILNATTAFFGLTLAALVFADEEFTTRKALGVTLGFAGVVVIMGLSSLMQFDIRSIAQLAILGAALSYGIAAVWARKTLSGIAPQSAALGMLICSSLIIVPLAMLVDGLPRFDLSVRVVLALLYISVMATACAYLLYYRVLSMAGSANLSLVTLLIVPFAVILGALVLGEQLPGRSYAGFALIACGMAVIDGRIWASLSRLCAR